MATDAPERIWVSKNTWTERKWSDPSDYGWYVLASRRLSPELVARLRAQLRWSDNYQKGDYLSGHIAPEPWDALVRSVWAEVQDG